MTSGIAPSHPQPTAALFPGQGAYDGALIAQAASRHPLFRDTLRQVDEIANEHLGITLTSTVFGDNPPGVKQLLATSPDLLQLGIYAAAVGAYRVLAAAGFSPSILVGHSFGEIAALVCGGAFSVAEGAEIVCHRIAALRTLAIDGAYMAAIGADSARVGRMLDLLGSSRVAVAVENHDQQVVVSGAAADMDALSKLCTIVSVSFIRLDSPYPFHSPLLEPAVQEFATRTRHLRQAPLTVEVYSPILGRAYDARDTLTERLAEHFVHPVRFAAALRRLREEGISRYVECGALDTLTRIVKRVLGSAADIATIACLPPAAGASALDDALRSVCGERAPVGVTGVREDLVDLFWVLHGERVRAFVRDELRDFTAQMEPPHAAATGPVVREPEAELLALGRPVDSSSREALFAALKDLYASALEYPSDVFTEDVELEAELGVDSVKQTELLARVAEQYQLPPRPEDFRLSDYRTMGQVTEFVHAMLAQRSGS